MAAVLNFIGALMSTNVARTIAQGLVNPNDATQWVILSGVIGAIVWNLITWKYGIPSSSSHALIGGLVGAAVIHGGIPVVIWEGILQKVLIPLVASPLSGFALGFLIMLSIFILLGRTNPGRVSGAFRHMQIFSAAAMAFTHGLNDAQKSMGIITMALVSQGLLSAPVVPAWVVLSCAVMMALGTSAGGWRIMRTMGHRIIRLEPVHGFAAETSASIVIFTASHFGMPVSTTHTISGSIFGVGSSKRLSAVRWGVAGNMVIAWVLTLPAAGTVAALTYLAFRILGAD
jgi:PiT family inorganic phosphate transporter